MSQVFQTPNQNIYEHGLSVKDYTFKLIDVLKTGNTNLKLPEWFIPNRELILNNLMSLDIIEEYTIFHDIGKVYCRVIDENGKQHFPNHAKVSHDKWLEFGGREIVAKLMLMDMDIHLLKAEDIEKFSNRPEAITLLIVGLAELNSNSNLFGGYDSTSFKIKYKHLDRRGKQIIKLKNDR